jgi:hypothetical protein
MVTEGRRRKDDEGRKIKEEREKEGRSRKEDQGRMIKEGR